MIFLHVIVYQDRVIKVTKHAQPIMRGECAYVGHKHFLYTNHVMEKSTNSMVSPREDSLLGDLAMNMSWKNCAKCQENI